MSQPPGPPAQSSIASYVDQAAALLGLTLAEAQRTGVIASMVVLAGVAAPLLEFPLAPDTEPAPVYEP
jgi:hypothetical protein